MSRPAYSKRFLVRAGLSGNSESVTVPDGRVYVIKQITFYANVISPTAAFLEDDVSGAALFSARFTGDLGGWQGFYGALVFEPGDGFHFTVDTGPLDAVDCFCSGYDLSLLGG
jgi:hypothetical protein